MESRFKKNPRTFTVNGCELKDFGKLSLSENEMVSLLSDSGKEVDITAKSWGYYLGPSLNARLADQGYKAALVTNQYKKIFVMIVDETRIQDFKNYLKDNQDNRILCWLDEWLREEL